MPEGQVSAVALRSESCPIGETETNANTASLSPPAAKNATEALVSEGQTAMDFAIATLMRRLSDAALLTDQTLYQTEHPWLMSTAKRERRTGRGRSSSLTK